MTFLTYGICICIVLSLLLDYPEHEWLYRFHADVHDRAAGIPIQGPETLELFCQELRKCREEDGEESSEEDPESRELGQLLNSLSECHSLLNSQM